MMTRFRDHQNRELTIIPSQSDDGGVLLSIQVYTPKDRLMLHTMVRLTETDAVQLAMNIAPTGWYLTNAKSQIK